MVSVGFQLKKNYSHLLWDTLCSQDWNHLCDITWRKGFFQDNYSQKFQNVELQSKIIFFIKKLLGSYYLPFFPLGIGDKTGIIPTFIAFNGKGERCETNIQKFER